MKTTITEILTEALAGKTVRAFQYSAFNKTLNKKITHFFLVKRDDIFTEGEWQNKLCLEVFVKIRSVGGWSDPYEGNHIIFNLDMGDDKAHNMYVDIDEALELNTMFTIQD